MYRISENIYIDETLITCAEYQLFIDQRRKKGKYFQPDHWKFQEFPAGQAREPILGVRFSDAKAFCDWLTNRKKDEFR
jgi:formylglycine-generating enzyme required for sulfatase activity